jgi:hypothetical protein
MNTETKLADALARELAERCGILAVGLLPRQTRDAILTQTKLPELCACAEALREIGSAFEENHEAFLGRPLPWRLLEPIKKAKQALAALDGAK